MKTIKQELQEAIQNIADNYGVVIGDISIKWINASEIDRDKYVISRIEISNSSVISPVTK